MFERARRDSLAVSVDYEYEATFIIIKYGDKEVLVNTDCSIRHLMLHIRERYIADGYKLDDDVLVIAPPAPKSTTKEDKLAKPIFTKSLDLLDDGAVPVEFCNKDPDWKVRDYVQNKGLYILCAVKRTNFGIIREANPLICSPSSEFKKRILTMLRTIEKMKRRGGLRTPERINPGKVPSDHRKKEVPNRKLSNRSPSPSRVFAGVAKPLR